MKFIIISIVSLFLLVTVGCSNDKDNFTVNTEEEFLNEIVNAPQNIVPKEELPEWLSDYIEKLSDTPPELSKLKVYMGIWKGTSVFFIYNMVNSCLFCDVFYEDGNRIEWEHQNDINEFMTNSKDWICIYVLK